MCIQWDTEPKGSDPIVYTFIQAQQATMQQLATMGGRWCNNQDGDDVDDVDDDDDDDDDDNDVHNNLPVSVVPSVTSPPLGSKAGRILSYQNSAIRVFCWKKEIVL